MRTLAAKLLTLKVRLGHMMHVEPPFVLYALHLDPGCCLRAHTVLNGTVELVEPDKKKRSVFFCGCGSACAGRCLCLYE